jgi:hypothetical protein
MVLHAVKTGKQVGAEATFGPQGIAGRGLPRLVLVDFREAVEVGDAAGPEDEEEQ